MYTTTLAPSQRTEARTSDSHCHPKNRSWLTRFFSQFSREARSVKRGLKEVEMIRAGKLKGKTYDAFLNEL